MKEDWLRKSVCVCDATVVREDNLTSSLQPEWHTTNIITDATAEANHLNTHSDMSVYLTRNNVLFKCKTRDRMIGQGRQGDNGVT